MGLVKIFNDNNYDLIEVFKGNPVHIGAKDYWRNKDGSIKQIDFYEAHEYKGQYHVGPIDTDGMLMNDPKHFKIIKIEPVVTDKKEPELEGVKCMVSGCRHVSPSPEELDAHNKVRHANQPVSEGTAEGPLNMNPAANATRPVFEPQQPSPGKEDAPSQRRKGQ